MRILKFTLPSTAMSSATFSLEEFTASQIPPVYAILSHRWAEDEVTFKDVRDRRGTTKEGYRKLEFCAKRAAEDGIVYFWVDTCCIDKTSSAELSEAINSMFKWYKNATRCYVYMSDVSVPGQDRAESTRGQWMPFFRKSEWFNRGWTLQELIAPSRVEFFSREGTYLGDKGSLEQEIEQITGLPIDVLRGEPLTLFSVEERLTWAARRVTTVEEDAAYCLLGLFDVHMPLIYGEGQEHAVDRLRREIYSSMASAPSLTTNAQWIVPFERNASFTGRERELAKLERQLFAQGRTSRWAISGLGGVGKTQLVIELLYRFRLKHRDCAVLWIPAVTSEGLYQGFVSVARQLGIPECDNESKDAVELVRDHLSQVSSGCWLLIFDNADDINLWTHTKISNRQNTAQECSYRLLDCLPQNSRGSIIFTTRNIKAATTLAGSNIVPLSAMDAGSATNMLKRYLVQPDLVEDTEATARLLAELAYLPLAIVQATAYINANGCQLRDYVHLLDEVEEEVIDLLSEDFEAEGRYRNLKNPIATTWLISFEQIQNRDPLAVEYLSFMACIHYKDIPQSLLPSGPSWRKEMEAVGTLAAYSFVERRAVDSALNLHRLVHLATRNWLRKKTLLSLWRTKTLAHLSQVFPSDNHQNRSTWRMYLPHAQYLLGSEGKDEVDERRTLMEACARCLFSDGRWNEAESFFAQLVPTRETSTEHNTDSFLKSTSWLAATYRYQGRWQEAEALEVQVMEQNKSKLGIDHPSTLTSMANLASTYQSQGRWEEAEALKVQVVEWRNSKLGIDHPDTLTSMANLASTYLNRGRWEEAELLFVGVVESRKSKLGMDHPSTLTSMTNLASTYRKQGRWEEAEELDVQVMEQSKSKLGIDHPSTLTSMHNVASTYWNQGRWGEAEALFVQVIEQSKSKLGIDHPDTLSSIAGLAATYCSQGRWEEAELLFVKVMESRKSKLGIDHPSTLNSMASLAATYRRTKRWKETEEPFVSASERESGKDHPSRLKSAGDRITTHWQSRLKKAEDLEARAMEISGEKLGFEHPITLKTMAGLAATYWRQSRWDQAEELEMQVMEKCKSKLGEDHPDALTSMHNLAFTWYGMGREDEAIDLMRRSIACQVRVFGTSHPQFLSSTKVLHEWEAGSVQGASRGDIV